IIKYVENQELPLKRQEQLEDGMCLAFVCAGISFNVAGNEIFRAWLQELRPGFNIPSPKTLAGRIFNKQLIKVEAKMENELQDKKNITLAHRLNLICKDIMKESFSKRILSQATLVAQFFKSSHIANATLENEIQINNIT
ncbi:9582_t:CDS:2, partial [Racocetra persica]